MKKAILCVLLTLSMSVSAFALEVPTDTVVQNLNGSQQVIKTLLLTRSSQSFRYRSRENRLKYGSFISGFCGRDI